jgi:hypothetical protein
LEAIEITDRDKPQQQRFFCESCQHEVFLQAKYCDNCGGKIEWPKEIGELLTGWKKTGKKNQ